MPCARKDGSTGSRCPGKTANASAKSCTNSAERTHAAAARAAGTEMAGLRSLIIGFLLGWSLAVAAAGNPIGENGARHLLERTGFGAPPAQLVEFSRLDREQAVDRILAATRTASLQPAPLVAYQRPSHLKGLTEEQAKAAQKEMFRQGMEMRAWWVGEMLRAPTAGDALTERMTLFWHNHFVSSQQKVKSGTLMLRQNVLLRRYALGNFSSLLHAVAKDPAMVIYLDSATNRKGNPNENFAREVMELFTLGEGHYTETDIKEAARAFTGWSFDPESGDFLWRPGMHDSDEKKVLGRSGNLDGDAVLDILLGQPATAEFIVGKLWREFVSPTPDKKEVRRIAASFRGAGYEIRAALKPLLLSPAFWATENRGSLVKSPVDIIVGTLRTLEVDVPDALPLALALRQHGQDLFAPPNVKGWPGGEAWINSTTLLTRKQFIERLLRAEEMPANRAMLRENLGKGVAKAGEESKARLMQAVLAMHFDSVRWLSRYRDVTTMEKAVLALPPAQPPAPEASGLVLLRGLLLDPVFQLK